MFSPRITSLWTMISGVDVYLDTALADPHITFSNANRTATCGSTISYSSADVAIAEVLLNNESVYFELVLTGINEDGFSVSIVDVSLNNNGVLSFWYDPDKQLYLVNESAVSLTSGDIVSVWRKNNNYWFGLNGVCLCSVIDSVNRQGDPVNNLYPHHSSSEEGQLYFYLNGPNKTPCGRIDLQLRSSLFSYSPLSGFSAWDSDNNIVYDSESLSIHGEIINSGLTFQQKEIVNELTNRVVQSTSIVPSSGNIYYEIKLDNITAGEGSILIGINDENADNILFFSNSGRLVYTYGEIQGQLYFSDGTEATFVEGDIIRIWRSSNLLWIGINNTVLYTKNGNEYLLGDPINGVYHHWSLLDYEAENPNGYAYVKFNQHGDQITSNFNEEEIFYSLGGSFQTLDSFSGGLVEVIQTQRIIQQPSLESSYLSAGSLGL